MSQSAACLIIRIEGPSAAYVTAEAERIRDLYKLRCSVSRPVAHNKRAGWWMVYLDIYRTTDAPKPEEAT